MLLEKNVKFKLENRNYLKIENIPKEKKRKKKNPKQKTTLSRKKKLTAVNHRSALSPC